jgi:hypothetical protein
MNRPGKEIVGIGPERLLRHAYFKTMRSRNTRIVTIQHKLAGAPQGAAFASLTLRVTELAGWLLTAAHRFCPQTFFSSADLVCPPFETASCIYY